MNLLARTRVRVATAALAVAIAAFSLMGANLDLQSTATGIIPAFIMRDGGICKYGPGGWC